MADTKISALSALTGANIATGDELVLVDKSDTTMAASGTDKRMTANELRIGLATTLGLTGIDAIYDAAGDLAVGTGADASTKLAVGTLAGQALSADPNATNKLSWNYPFSVEDTARGTTGSLASTIDRRWAASWSYTISAATSGMLRLYGICLPKGLPVTNITFWTGNTGLGGGANQWFGLFDASRNVLALTADDGATAWANSTAKTLAITGGPYVTTTAGWYYIGIMVKATTVPTIVAIPTGDTTTLRLAAPIVGGNSTVSLTNPASCTGQQTAISISASMAYAEIS